MKPFLLIIVYLIISVTPTICSAMDADSEISVSLAIARAYGLTRDQAKLLLAVRSHEAGRKGKEFGVLSPNALIFNDGYRSFCIQCCYACETIKKRYKCKNDLYKFSKRYCPIGAKNDPRGLNFYFYQSVKHKLKEFNDILY